MQTKVNVNARYAIPICYRCSKCGELVHAQLPQSSIGQCFVQGMANDKKKAELVTSARKDAREMLETFIKKVYQRDAVYHYKSIIGQCTSCGHLEAWQEDPKKLACREKYENSFIRAGILLSFLLAIIAGAAFNSFLVGILALLAEVGLFFAIIFLLNKKKKDDSVEFMDSASVPEGSRPKYVFSLEEVLAQLDREITYE